MRWSNSRDASDRVAGAASSRMTVSSVDDSKLMQQMTGAGFAGEQQQDIEHAHPYGFTAVPQAPSMIGGIMRMAEAFFAFMNGNRSHGVALVTGDRRFRLFGLQPGEVALHDDQGHQSHITRNGVVMSAPNGKSITGQVMSSSAFPAGPTGMGQKPQAGQTNVASFLLDATQFVGQFGTGANAIFAKADQHKAVIRHKPSGNTIWVDANGIWSTAPVTVTAYPYGD
jgi:Bacteriophage Mu Gp45 spike protein